MEDGRVAGLSVCSESLSRERSHGCYDGIGYEVFIDPEP
jgi:hypothetical protein